MQKFTYLLMLMVIVISCTGDDDGNQENYEIYGSWNINSSELYSGDNDTLLSTYEPENSCEQQTYITFNEDGTGNNYEYYLENGDCVYDDINLYFTYAEDTDILTLTLFYDGFEQSTSFQVVELTQDRLILRTFAVEDSNEDGILDYDHIIFDRL